jgi:hypothetical protein
MSFSGIDGVKRRGVKRDKRSSDNLTAEELRRLLTYDGEFYFFQRGLSQ